MSKSTRLIGFLISYADDKAGRHQELRVGRTLIGEEGANVDQALGLSDDSISAPHLALQARENHELIVQDIFSEHGTYLVKSGTTSEVRLSGPTPVAHGDWIRVGKHRRFQVCLIDGRRK